MLVVVPPSAIMSRALTAAVLLGLVCFAAATTEEGKKFLQENAKREGVVELASGLQV